MRNRYELRYVLDVGSNATKTVSCVVDKQCNVIVAVLEAHKAEAQYQKYIKNNILVDEGIKKGLAAFNNILDFYSIDPKQDGVKFVGIATAWARNAVNSREYLDKVYNELGIKILQISQEEEGILAMKAAIASPRMVFVDLSKLVILDIGGGSFQLSYTSKNQIKVLNGPCGAINFGHYIKSILNIQNESYLNDAQIDSALEVGMDYISSTILSDDKFFNSYLKLESKKVYAIGQFINVGIHEIIKSATITIADVQAALYIDSEMVDFFSEAHAKKQSEQINLILLLSIMKVVDIEKIILLPDVYSINAVSLESNLWDEDCGMEDSYHCMYIDQSYAPPVWAEKFL